MTVMKGLPLKSWPLTSGGPYCCPAILQSLPRQVTLLLFVITVSHSSLPRPSHNYPCFSLSANDSIFFPHWENRRNQKKTKQNLTIPPPKIPTSSIQVLLLCLHPLMMNGPSMHLSEARSPTPPPLCTGSLPFLLIQRYHSSNYLLSHMHCQIFSL